MVRRGRRARPVTGRGRRRGPVQVRYVARGQASDQAVGEWGHLEFGQGIDGFVLAVDQLLGKMWAAQPEDAVLDDVRLQVGKQAARHPLEALLVEVRGVQRDPQVGLHHEQRMGPAFPVQAGVVGGRFFLYENEGPGNLQRGRVGIGHASGGERRDGEDHREGTRGLGKSRKI